MIRVATRVEKWFSRSRLRKGPKFTPQMKDYTRTPQMQKQIKQYREEFEIKSARQSLHQALNDPKPQLGRRFKVDVPELNKEMKSAMKEALGLDRLKPVSDEQDDLKFVQEGRSHLYDQTIEVEFEEKFRRQLFRQKETQRLVNKQEQDYRNFLPGNQNNAYNSYAEAKKKLKNRRIENMMNYQRSNPDLQLLIDAGLSEQPRPLLMALVSQSETETAENVEGQEIVVRQEEGQNYPLESGDAQRGPHTTQMQQFIRRYRESNELDQEKADQQVDLLKQIKKYEHQLFLSRYDMINYRFKGRVEFKNFKEPQLLSYLKHESIEPMNLLQFYQQQQNQRSRFNTPIITPTVMSRVYSRSSTYRFPQNDENNHINLLAHPTFMHLQRHLFKQAHTLADQHYCDAVCAYAQHHKLEQGQLHPKQAQKIQQKIYAELQERIYRLSQADLGIVLRALTKLALPQNQDHVIQALVERLPTIRDPYHYEGAMEFAAYLSSGSEIVNLVGRQIGYFSKYAWQDQATILSFTRACSLLLNNRALLDPLQHNNIFRTLKETLALKNGQISNLITELTINELPRVVTVFGRLASLPLSPNLPPIIFNNIKKAIVDKINTQQDKIYPFTIPNLINVLSSYDYQHGLLPHNKFSFNTDLTPVPPINPHTIAPLFQLLPPRAIPFNSKLYFPYHRLAQAIQAEASVLTIKALTDSLYGLSLVDYKNEGLYDNVTSNVLERTEKALEQKKHQTLSVQQTGQLIKIVNCYSLQKRSTDVVEEVYDLILDKGSNRLPALPLSLIARLFASYSNIFTLPISPESSAWKRHERTVEVYLYFVEFVMGAKVASLSGHETIALLVTNSTLLSHLQMINNDTLKDNQTMLDYIKKLSNCQRFIREAIKRHDQLELEQSFILQLCQLVTSDGNLENEKFKKAEISFYDKHIETIKKNEQHVGSQYSYPDIFAQIEQKISKQGKSTTPKIWRIQVGSAQTVYFLASYTHLKSRIEDKTTFFGLYGIWRLYSFYYRRQGWQFQIVTVMMQ